MQQLVYFGLVFLFFVFSLNIEITKFSYINNPLLNIKKNSSINIESLNFLFVILLILVTLLILILIILKILQKINLKKIQLRNSNIEQDNQALEMILNHKNNLESKLKDNKMQISMELHDNIVNKLFSIRFLLHKDYVNTKSIIYAKNTLLEVKEALENINSNFNKIDKLFERDSFHDTLIELINIQPNNLIKFKYDIAENIKWSVFDNKVRFHLYRILQELFQNIHKHSKANVAQINMQQYNNSLIIIVSDNGNGFNKNIKNGIGLKNIKNRLNEINGDLKIDYKPETKFTIKININNADFS